jgi:hypothetical protein
VESFGISTRFGSPSSHTVATHSGRVAGVVDGCRSTYRISPSAGATIPKTGLIVTLPFRLIRLLRSRRVGLTVVSTVPRRAPSWVCARFPRQWPSAIPAG